MSETRWVDEKPKTMREVEYKCTKCSAVDRNRYYPEENVWIATTCWKCHAGSGTTPEQMAMNRHGMLPVPVKVH